MSYKTSIEWTDSTWNPVIGCSKVSPGCKYCYAEAITRQLKGVKGHSFELGFQIRLRPDCLHDPAYWKSPRKIFTCSMSDLFHEEVPFEFIKKVFSVMEAEKRHTIQVLTKRSERLLEFCPKFSIYYYGLKNDQKSINGFLFDDERIGLQVDVFLVRGLIGER